MEFKGGERRGGDGRVGEGREGQGRGRDWRGADGVTISPAVRVISEEMPQQASLAPRCSPLAINACAFYRRALSTQRKPHRRRRTPDCTSWRRRRLIWSTKTACFNSSSSSSRQPLDLYRLLLTAVEHSLRIICFLCRFMETVCTLCRSQWTVSALCWFQWTVRILCRSQWAVSALYRPTRRPLSRLKCALRGYWYPL